MKTRIAMFLAAAMTTALAATMPFMVALEMGGGFVWFDGKVAEAA